MVPDNLKERLRRMRQQSGQAVLVKEKADHHTSDTQTFCAPGWQQRCPGVFECINYYTISGITDTHIVPCGYYSAHLKDQKCNLSDLIFFDLETTGLSGGAGTVAFLAALGRIIEGRLQLTQLFLADYPYETAFLEHICQVLGTATFLVSYNGLSYDLPLLRTRCIINGLPPPPLLKHIDLVYCARSLWRYSLPDRSLHTVEQCILQKKRSLDIPGFLIPQTWFSFLKNGELDSLETVFIHNADDIISLAELLVFLNKLIQPGLSIPLADSYGEARLWARLDPAEAMSRLDVPAREGHRLALKLLLALYRQNRPRGEYRVLRVKLLSELVATDASAVQTISTTIAGQADSAGQSDDNVSLSSAKLSPS